MIGSTFFPLLNIIAVGCWVTQVSMQGFLVDARMQGANNTFTNQVPKTIDKGESYISVPAIEHVVSQIFFAPPASYKTAPLNFISKELQNGITIDSMSFDQGGNAFPPDPHGAAGPLSIISVVNFRIQSLEKDGKLKWEVLLTDFFATLQPTKMVYDPKIIYDVHSNVFAVVALEGAFECTTKVSNILLAVSKNNNPTNQGDWNFKKIKSFDDVGNSWADYPGFECDEDAYYITANMFGCIGGLQRKLWVVKKNDFLNDQPQGFYLEHIGTAQPAEIRDKSGAGQDIGTYLVGDSGDGFTIIQIKNPTGSPTLSSAHVTLDLGTLSNPDAAQKGATQGIWTGDSRTLDAVWHNNSVWFVTVRQNKNKATAVWVQIDVSKWPALAVIQSGIIDVPGESTFMPSIAMNKNGIAAFGFAGSGSNIYAGAFFTWRRPTDAKGTTRAVETLRAGIGSYLHLDGFSRNRWGDYTGISIDPTSEDCFWVYNQYAGGNTCGDSCTQAAFGTWNTAWARFCVAPVTRPSSKPSLKPSARPSTKSKKSAKKKKSKKGKNKKNRSRKIGRHM